MIPEAIRKVLTHRIARNSAISPVNFLLRIKLSDLRLCGKVQGIVTHHISLNLLNQERWAGIIIFSILYKTKRPGDTK
jgi:hypothetical protein